jgi:hypothetical protein
LFEHNKHQLETAKELSEKLGIDKFIVKKSRPLEKGMSLSGTIKPVYNSKYFRHKTRTNKKANTTDILDPYCVSGDMHYVDANGNYKPCAMFSELVIDNNKYWKPYNIADYTPTQINDMFINFKEKHLDNGIETAPLTCQKQCKKLSTRTTELAPNCAINKVLI